MDFVIEVKTTGGGEEQLQKFRREFKNKAKKTLAVTLEEEGKATTPAWMFLLQH